MTGKKYNCTELFMFNYLPVMFFPKLTSLGSRLVAMHDIPDATLALFYSIAK